MTDDKDYKYVVYATSNYGEGMVQQLGEYTDIDEITINTGMFNKDVIIIIEKKYEKKTNDR